MKIIIYSRASSPRRGVLQRCHPPESSPHRRIVSLTLTANACLWCSDLSSSLILEEEEEEEEPYDDIEQLSGPPLPHPVPGLDTGDEEDEDIYEVLPGMRVWLECNTHTRTHTQSLAQKVCCSSTYSDHFKSSSHQ